jgi:hypothetical protein
MPANPVDRREKESMTSITDIRFLRVRGNWHYDKVLGKGRSASPAHIYPELRPARRR